MYRAISTSIHGSEILHWYFCCKTRSFGRRNEEEGLMASEGFHESTQDLTTETREMHRAIVSLKEELEAIDWYQQRIDATTDDALRAILTHNRDEEKEHASMVLEWIRRHDPVFDANLKKYLFTTLPITERAGEPEAQAEAQPAGGKRWNG
jgi:uncharacterized protein